LSSVLATLQPDQYRLVTWPDDRPLIVQGSPGTGKTIVATHRAAYLTHAERESRLRRVAIVGPTEQYVDHVRDVVADLGAQDVRVTSLPALLERLAGIHRASGMDTDRRLDTAWKLGRVADRAANALARRLRGMSPERAMREVVKGLVGSDPAVSAVVASDPEIAEWLSELRTWDRATKDPRYLPFLATVGQAVRRQGSWDTYEHIIVDEAQDVRPLEWRVLLNCLEPGGTLSLFGDVNQRRSDWSAPNWAGLVRDLELDDPDDPDQAAVQVLELGYRSTEAILRFANQLLPRAERATRALRVGVAPVVRKASAANLVVAAQRVAGDLSERHPHGLVAIISMDPQTLSDRYRKDGWRRGRAWHSWTNGRRTVIVLHPHNARGLEFDGVVVLEPVAFPENVGRLGLLYTALTRATQELAVVHSGPLPRILRQPRN
jgi:DNA helicase IV